MGGVMPPEYHAAYEARYYADPENRARRAMLARKRRATPEGRKRADARLAVRKAVKAGVLHRQPCEVCGAEKVEAHHPDYSQPLYVVWLCPPHHRAQHPRPRKPSTARTGPVTHCLKGHPFDEANTYIFRGKRNCRACNADSALRARARRKAKALSHD